MRDISNEVATWNEFEELPPRLEWFREFVISMTEGPLVVVGDNRGLLAAGLSADREVTLVRHRDDLESGRVRDLDKVLETYSRGSTVADLMIPNGVYANGKYRFIETHLANEDFFDLLGSGVTLVANGVLMNFYGTPLHGMTWLDRLNETALPMMLIRNAGQGLLNTPRREAAYLAKRGWPATSFGEDQYVIASRNRNLITEHAE